MRKKFSATFLSRSRHESSGHVLARLVKLFAPLRCDFSHISAPFSRSKALLRQSFSNLLIFSKVNTHEAFPQLAVVWDEEVE